jgi:hypothetical protein
MTIAVGLLLPSNELILAADTQETFPDAKVEGQKILALSDQREPQGCVAFTGAGDADYLDSLGQKILGVFHDQQELSTPRELGRAFEGEARRFYRRHVVPFGEAWVKNDQLAVSAIIAYQRGTQRALYRSTMGALKECSYAAVGTGQVHALTLLGQLRRYPMTTETALRLVALAIFRAKDRDPYCGKRTHLALLSKNCVQIVDDDIISAWEDVFQELAGFELALKALGLGIMHGRPDQFRGLIEEIDKMPTRFKPSGIT